MDSELLRRETGDIHASFAMLQMSQADLLQQFCILQENFAGLLHSFEENKRIQGHQQAVIHQLAERQGLSQNELLQLQGNLIVCVVSYDYWCPLFLIGEIAHGHLQHSHQPHFDSFNHDNSAPNSNSGSPLTLFVTSPADPHDAYNPMQFVNEHVLQHPLQQTPEVTMSMYNTANSPSMSPVSPNPLDNAANMPLPPSPVSTVMMGSPHLVENIHDAHYRPLKFEDMNTLGVGLS